MAREASTATPDTRVIREAAAWLVRLGNGKASAAELEACEIWRRAHPSHEQAWRKAEVLRSKLGALPPTLSVPVLARPQADRRVALKTLSMIGIVAPTAWLSSQYLPWQSWRADASTSPGEQRLLTMADGTTVLLNTRTSLDTYLNANERLIRLHEGEILVATAEKADPRPFFVETAQGRMQALGTRFMVREQPAETRLTVLEHQVAIIPLGASEPAMTLNAGEKTAFGPGFIQPLQPVSLQDAGWTQGVIYANDIPLGEFLQELGRYRSGIIRCTPGAAELRLSGAFQLPDTDRILQIIANTLHLHLSYRTRYWVHVDTRSA